MLRDVTAARALDSFRLSLRFDDGETGEIDVRDLIPFEGVFEPLRDAAFFAQVRVNSELGCVEWPNGADLDTLHESAPDSRAVHLAMARAAASRAIAAGLLPIPALDELFDVLTSPPTGPK